MKCLCTLDEAVNEVAQTWGRGQEMAAVVAEYGGVVT